LIVLSLFEEAIEDGYSLHVFSHLSLAFCFPSRSCSDLLFLFDYFDVLSLQRHGFINALRIRVEQELLRGLSHMSRRVHAYSLVDADLVIGRRARATELSVSATVVVICMLEALQSRREVAVCLFLTLLRERPELSGILRI
jgi:hypothetical protein